MEEIKTEGKILQDRLFNRKENGWKGITEDRKRDIFDYCDKYISFLNNGKTEREIVVQAKKIADSNGFKDINEYEVLKPGDKVYYINREKVCILL